MVQGNLAFPSGNTLAPGNLAALTTPVYHKRGCFSILQDTENPSRTRLRDRYQGLKPGLIKLLNKEYLSVMVIEKIQKLMDFGLLVSPWLAGVGKRSRFDDDIFEYLDGQA